MKKLYFALATLFLATACNTNPSESEAAESDTSSDTTAMETEEPVGPSLTLQWESDTSLITNESVLYNAQDRMFYVSNIHGKPTEKDGMGYISKVRLDGTVEKLKWAEGLNAPKGSAILNGKLYVTNIDELVRINMSTGTIEQRYQVPGAKFLNDVTAGNEIVYFSDMETGKLHALRGDVIKTVAENMPNLNGLAYYNNTLYTLSNAGLATVDVKTGEMNVINADVAGGDGLIVLDESTFIASKWQGEIWLVRAGEATKLLDSSAEEIQTADIGYVAEEQLVVVPRFFANKISAYKLTL